MENNRDKSGKIVRNPLRGLRGRIWLYCFTASLLLALLALLTSLILPNLVSSNYQAKNLNQLRTKAAAVNNEFFDILKNIADRKEQLAAIELPPNQKDIFPVINNINTDPEQEGIGFYSFDLELLLWAGRVIDLESTLSQEAPGFLQQNTSFVIHNGTSVFLASIQRMNRGYIVLYRVLAFLPQFKTQYLKEFHFLGPELQQNTNIEYLDFRDDVGGFERLFLKHNDEYIGQPGLQNEIQTIFFPLRNESGRIIATVKLSSLSQSAKLSRQKDILLLFFYIFFGTALIFAIIFLMISNPFPEKHKFYIRAQIIIYLLGLRVLFFPLSRLDTLKSLTIFSPASSGFISLWGLTRSPAEIFVTFLILFLILNYIFFYLRRHFLSGAYKTSVIITLGANTALVCIFLVLIRFFRQFLATLVFSSSFNLLHIAPKLSFFLLHASVLMFFLTILVFFYSGLKIFSAFSSHNYFPFLAAVFVLSGFFLLQNGSLHLLDIFFQGLLLLLILSLVYAPRLKSKITYPALIFLASILLITSTIHSSNTGKHNSLLENSLKNSITSQRDWGLFLTRQAIPEFENKSSEIISLLSGISEADLAPSLWRRTMLAKFNWYSSLELIDKDGNLLSRFSLNIPEPFQPQLELPFNPSWSIVEKNVTYLNKEKDFLIAYKDWQEADKYLGRTVLYLAIDYEMLSFLYSAAPYFELMKVSSIPSLNQMELGFAVYNSHGRLLFNPSKITTGIPSELLQRIKTTNNSVWSTFADKGNNYRSLYFESNNKIYALFLPIKGFLTYAVEFFKLFTLYLGILLAGLLLISFFFVSKKLKNPFWSFSNRVYISFVAIALIPLLVFTFSTQGFFARVFTQKITEEAEAQANFAQRVMEEFILLQQSERISLTIPPNDMVLWISSTISKDVNLYLDGKITSSSRREFFDYGLLPELIDGEIYYRLQYENNPFYMQSQKIGEYSFHTLTIPYSFQETLLLISLPFPLEQQEISRSTAELLEFLFFISFLFITAVLLFARGIGDMIITPIRKLLSGTKEVSLGNLEISIPYNHQDEMKTLIDGFNTMVKSLKQHQQEVADLGKKVAWAEMARKVAHEIKNPLTPIQLSAEHLLSVYADKRDNFADVLQESTTYIVKEVENLRRIAQQFLETSKETALKKEKIDLKLVIKDTITPYRNMLVERITISENYSRSDFIFMGDKAKIKVALRNILTNAIESIPHKGRITVALSTTAAGIKLEISDTGTGIEQNKLDRVFEPYFSTKDAGTGLGLPIAKKIITDHGGTIKAMPNHPHGLKIEIVLPT